MVKMRGAILLAMGALVAVACSQSGLDQLEELPVLDEDFFRCEVQPVLASSCAFVACHGDEERPLLVYAEQRLRLDTSWLDYEDPITVDELEANLRAVRGFVARDAAEPDLLSEKPLDTRAGGLFHRGRDLYGDDDVFLSEADARYQVLRTFIAGERAAPDCTVRQDLGL